MALKRTEKVALSIAGLGFFGAIGAAAIAVTGIPDPIEPGPPDGCVALYESYVEGIESSPVAREALLPGEDGRSILSTDPYADYCGFTAITFED
ncbi:hypothetical protein [Blastococcus goldschmidtiae]|uniref:Uncharacterized protein n=1 Tax=Blastococcus goldschmidtiae TaxID=3075546 RepID=A0ABU2K947_9ACTN|nr:hypothetical protein [Blastococcus sp. DSM 46792]MDT0276716.1 hypothetical protein [Blastococcus sp. DSM 46792]